MRFLFKSFSYLFSLGAACAIGGFILAGYLLAGLSAELPDYSALKNYSPPVITRIHADDGTLMAEFARQRRLFLPITSIPPLVIDAFLSAEDKNFYIHGGLDFAAIIRSALVNLRNAGTGRRPIGASTISQQVARNFLLTNELSYTRKIKEQLLTLRIERAFSKDELLQLYLNEIYMGVGAYGIAAAALSYFDKAVDELTLPEAAFLAALPKAPGNYHPVENTERATERRNWVLGRMAANGMISGEEARAAMDVPLTVQLRTRGTHLAAADYFSEEVRRLVAGEFGEERLYLEGLSIRTSLDPHLQVLARTALMDGLVAFDEERGEWRGPLSRLLPGGQDPASQLLALDHPEDLPGWSRAVVMSLDGTGAQIEVLAEPAGTASHQGAQGGHGLHAGIIPPEGIGWKTHNGRAVRGAGDLLQPGDMIYVEAMIGRPGYFRLRQIPEISGAIIALDAYTGRVLAMVGGFSFGESQFNRATQALRQPGSAFKPFVYSAALDSGYTPSSVVMDAPIELEQGPGLELWRPRNYGGEFYGPSTLRTGIELSRNVMTVRLAEDLGMPVISEYARRFGIYDDLMPVLSMSLGAGETTLLRLAAAYAMLANGGTKVTPTFIDRIQDRYGATLAHSETRQCVDCSIDPYGGSAPQLVDERERVLDPMTAYQITSMLEGVVTRGTARRVRIPGHPIAGKTGTTNDEKDAWFVGFTPGLVVGVYVGYDNPRPMGEFATGGRIAAPIFADFMSHALVDVPPREFQVPQGLQLVAIDRQTGMRASTRRDDAIIEAFKPGTGPPDNLQIIDFAQNAGNGQPSPEATQNAVMSGTGGLY